ncbi:hypothetical protein BH10PSE13_BH10PSE13_21100 [soil metagenome]
MMEYHNINPHVEKAVVTGQRYRDVPSPHRVDGVGIALRRAFTLDSGADDFSMLLQELDRQTQS